jgi:hypothetical protein
MADETEALNEITALGQGVTPDIPDPKGMEKRLLKQANELHKEWLEAQEEVTEDATS